MNSVSLTVDEKAASRKLVQRGSMQSSNQASNGKMIFLSVWVNNCLLILSYKQAATRHVFPHIHQKHILIVTINELHNQLCKVNLQQSNAGVQTWIHSFLKKHCLFCGAVCQTPSIKNHSRWRKVSQSTTADRHGQKAFKD